MRKAVVTLEIVDIVDRTPEEYDKFCNILVQINKHAIEKFSKGDMQLMDLHMNLLEPMDTPEARKYAEDLTKEIKLKKLKILLPGGTH